MVFNDRTGEENITNEGYIIKIVKYNGFKECTIQFLCNNYTCMYNYSSFQTGSIKNPFHKSVFGVGFKGIGEYKCKGKIYVNWTTMLSRCYSLKRQLKQTSYQNITVCKEWHNFQNFAKWFNENYNPETMQGWQLDKDIICKDCKVYSPNNCTFVPHEINLLFVKKEKSRGLQPIGVSFDKEKNKYIASISRNSKGIFLGYFNTSEEAFQAYKTAKEAHIKEVATDYYTSGKINERVYQALMKYEVEITD